MTTEGPVFIHHRIPAAHNSSSIMKKNSEFWDTCQKAQYRKIFAHTGLVILYKLLLLLWS